MQLNIDEDGVCRVQAVDGLLNEQRNTHLTHRQAIKGRDQRSKSN